MSAIIDLCDRCHRLLTADHVLRAGARHCYAGDLRFLQAQDTAGRAGRAGRPLRSRRRSRSARRLRPAASWAWRSRRSQA